MANSLNVKVGRRGAGWTCEVEVDQEGRRSRYTVHVAPADVARWGRGAGEDDVADLVRRSFEFLLAREPAESILRTFDLSVIRSYFPEYDREFKA